MPGEVWFYGGICGCLMVLVVSVFCIHWFKLKKRKLMEQLEEEY